LTFAYRTASKEALRLHEKIVLKVEKYRLTVVTDEVMHNLIPDMKTEGN